MIPSWWAFVLLSVAAFRLWKLVADDRILDRPRNWLLDRVVGRRGEKSGVYWSDFLTCPWCAGFWITLLIYVGYIALGPGYYDTDELFMGAVSVFAISGVVGMLGTTYFAIADDG